MCESELIKRGTLKVGDIYRKELLNCYAADNKCMLVEPNSLPRVYIGNDSSDFKIKDIINNCLITQGEIRNTNSFYCDSIIVIEKVENK